jgi:hypothetical protein
MWFKRNCSTIRSFITICYKRSKLKQFMIYLRTYSCAVHDLLASCISQFFHRFISCVGQLKYTPPHHSCPCRVPDHHTCLHSTNIITLAVPWLRRLLAGLSPRRPGFDPGSVHVEFVVDKVALWQVFLRILRFSPVNFIPPVLEKQKKRPHHLHHRVAQ